MCPIRHSVYVAELLNWRVQKLVLHGHWVGYSKPKDEMFAHTDRKLTPWYVVNADDKKRGSTASPTC